MEKNKSLVEDTILQIKNLEDLVAENAQGILSSTMSKEISELVKESLKEQDDEEEVDDTEVEMDDTEVEDDEMDSDMEDDEMDTDNLDVDMDMDMDMDMSDEPVIDMTGEENPDEVLRVFQLMGPDDEIVVKKDDSGNINLKDTKNNTEYMIVGESEEEEFDMDFSSDDDDDVMSAIDKAFNDEEMEESWEDEEDEGVVYEVEMDDTELEESWNEEEEEEGEVVYEIEMDEEEDEEAEEMDEEYEEEEDENYDLDSVMESITSKPKGVGMGKPKFNYDSKPNQSGGFKTKMKEGPKTMGTGKPKFEFKEGKYGMNKGDKSKTHKGDMDYTAKKGTKSKTHKGLDFEKTEAKEASRTYGNGSKSGRGLRKAITPNRNLTFESTDNKEIQILREKNEEYRKALNLFRDKLNEVAVFNSNLAYATRLFTEHTTTKQEKINILKRFDEVETIKESKNLYKTIKQELGSTNSKPMNESMDRALNSSPTNGSAVSLIESKTYENPQFMRMKDLMSKLK